MMKITLQVNGRKMTFSKSELAAIVEGHFRDEVTKPKTAPTELETVPTELKTVPTELETVSKKLETVPTELKTVPTELETAPTELETVSKKLETVPTELKTVPTELETAPTELETVSKKLETVPTELKTVPTEGKKFAVKPTTINRQLFQSKRSNLRQERTRQLILEAFAEADANPKRYSRSFKTLMPEKNWTSKTIEELKAIAQGIENHMANWVEQALEWAQRISNGESWSAVCNDRDTANWYRAIIWKNGYTRMIGSSINYSDDRPSSSIFGFDYYDGESTDHAVPLIVLY